MALIQLASPFSAFPCASGRTQSGFFFITLHTPREPSSPDDKKFSSLISLTFSILPWCPLYMSWDSSAIFQIRIVQSLPPDVMARSRDKASIPVIGAWWPNLHYTVYYVVSKAISITNIVLSHKLSMYAISSSDHTFTERSLLAVYSEWVSRRNTKAVTVSRWPWNVCKWFRVFGHQIWTNELVSATALK